MAIIVIIIVTVSNMAATSFMDLVVGIDAGGTWIRAALGTPQGKILRRISSRLDLSYAASFEDQIASAAIAAAGGDLRDVGAICVAVAGRLDLKNGTLVSSPHARVGKVPLADTIRAKTGKPTLLANDNVAAALAEKRLGCGGRHANMVYVGIGTGIGGGAFVDGKLLIGKDGNAHEIGHMVIDIAGRLTCACGGAGHWEAYTSGSGLPNLARLLSAPAKDAPAGTSSAVGIFTLADRGNEFASSVLGEAATINAKAISNLVSLYDPSLIAIGGGVAVKNPGLVIDPLKALVPELCFNAPPEIAVSSLGAEAQLIGALLWAGKPEKR